jgi:hypothetical protein
VVGFRSLRVLFRLKKRIFKTLSWHLMIKNRIKCSLKLLSWGYRRHWINKNNSVIQKLFNLKKNFKLRSKYISKKCSKCQSLNQRKNKFISKILNLCNIFLINPSKKLMKKGWTATSWNKNWLILHNKSVRGQRRRSFGNAKLRSQRLTKCNRCRYKILISRVNIKICRHVAAWKRTSMRVKSRIWKEH